MPGRGRHDPGTTINRGRVPLGMLRSPPTFRNGHLESFLVDASTARKVGTRGNGIRVHFLAISKVDFLGSAMEAVEMGSMAKTIFSSIHKGAGL